MTVATPVQPDFPNQDGTTYKAYLDAAFAVAWRAAMAFAPHEQTSPGMTVRVDAGFLFDGATRTEVAAQSTATITAPVSNPRKDLVTIDKDTGAVGVVTGTEAVSPAEPDCPAGKLPVAIVTLATSTTAITNSLLTDRRAVWTAGLGAAAFLAIGAAANQIPTNAMLGGAAFRDVYDVYNPASTPGLVVALDAEGGVPAAVSALPRGYIDGFVLSNNGSDANNDIDIAAGAARDSTNVANINLTSALTKRLDATWAAGTNQGGLDTGSEANSTWYHVFAIRNPTTLAVDAQFSTSPTAPTMPSGYTQKRRLGAVRNNGSGNIVAFKQFGDEFWWLTPILDVNTSGLGTSSTLFALTVPTGVRIKAIINANSADDERAIYIRTPDLTDLAPSFTASPLGTLQRDDTGGNTFMRQLIHAPYWTDTSAQIAARATFASQNLLVATVGYVDPRGRDA